jgi:hypothetical protein
VLGFYRSEERHGMEKEIEEARQVFRKAWDVK